MHLNCIITKIVFDPLLSLYGFSTQHVEAKHQFLSLCQKVFGCFYGLSLAPIIRVLQLSLGWLQWYSAMLWELLQTMKACHGYPGCTCKCVAILFNACVFFLWFGFHQQKQHQSNLVFLYICNFGLVFNAETQLNVSIYTVEICKVAGTALTVHAVIHNDMHKTQHYPIGSKHTHIYIH